VPVVKQYFGADSTNRGFDQHTANDLNANGITTVVYWGGLWVLWGPHTAAYQYGSVMDNRSIFDNSIRMMMYVSNSFQAEHALTIDQPMTRAMADTIKNREQEKMDALAAVGAIIGTPKVDFRPSENSLSSLVEGDFVWNVSGTTTPPFKSGTLKVAYTTDGFNSFFGEVE
jgi:phage tail sheath protein FI